MAKTHILKVRITKAEFLYLCELAKENRTDVAKLIRPLLPLPELKEAA